MLCQLQVTGPDSKGLKSKYNAFHIFRNGSTTLSCTAVLLLNTTEGSPRTEATGSTTATVVAPVTCLYPFLQASKRSRLSSASSNDLIPSVSCSVLLRPAEVQQLLLRHASKGRSSYNRPQHADSATDNLLVRLSSKLVHILKLPKVESTVDHLLLSANANSTNEWKLGWCLADQQPLAAATAAMVGHIALLHVDLTPYATDMLSSRQAPFATVRQHTSQAAVNHQEAANCCAEHDQQLVTAPDHGRPLLNAVDCASGSSSSPKYTSRMHAQNQHTVYSCSSEESAVSSGASCSRPAAGPVLQQGMAVTVTGSPFGCLAEQHFFRAVVTGCVSLVIPVHDTTSPHLSAAAAAAEAAAVAVTAAPRQAVLFIVDARCMPGMEGGPICCRSCGAIIGLLGVPLSSCSAQAELLLGISTAHVAAALEGTAHSHLQGVLQSSSICCCRQEDRNSSCVSRGSGHGCSGDEVVSQPVQRLQRQATSGLGGQEHAVLHHRQSNDHHQQQRQQSRSGVSVQRMQTLLKQLNPALLGAPERSCSSSQPSHRLESRQMSRGHDAGTPGCSGAHALGTQSDVSNTSDVAGASSSVVMGTAGSIQKGGAPVCSVSTVSCSLVSAVSHSSPGRWPGFDASTVSSSCRDAAQHAGLFSAAAGVVMVRTEGSWGSGVVVSTTGLVMTVAHLFRKHSTAVQAGRHACGSERYMSELPTGAAMQPEQLLSCTSSVHKLQLSAVDGPQKSKSGVQASFAAESVYTLDNQHQHESAAGEGEDIHIRITVNSGSSSGSRKALWVPAKVLYCFSSYLDLAVLQILPSSLRRLPAALLQPLQLVPHKCDVTPGSDVCVIGHGLFGPSMGLTPAVTAGCVAAVVKLPCAADPANLMLGRQQPARDQQHEAHRQQHPQCHQQHQQQALPCPKPSMVISTAAVHSGASGGALVDAAGRLVGLVTSNARHAGGQTLPHMNFCISAEELRPVWEWCQQQQLAGRAACSATAFLEQQQQLKQLDVHSAAGAKLWALQPYMHVTTSAGC